MVFNFKFEKYKIVILPNNPVLCWNECFKKVKESGSPVSRIFIAWFSIKQFPYFVKFFLTDYLTKDSHFFVPVGNIFWECGYFDKRKTLQAFDLQGFNVVRTGIETKM